MPDITYTLLVDGSAAPPEILRVIQDIQVENNIDMADMFRLRFSIGQSDTQDWTILEDDLFPPLTPVTITIQVGTGESEPLISGYVTAQNVEISTRPGASILEVVGMDATVLMNLEEKVVAWPNMADSDIAAAIFGEHGLIAEVEQTQPVRQEADATTIQRGTDIQFLRSLARRHGFECYVETDPDQNADVGYFRPPQLQGNPQGVLSVNFGDATNVISFSVRYEMTKPAEAKAANVDINTGQIQDGQVQTSGADLLGQEGLHDRIEQPALLLPSKTGLTTAAELDTLCRAIADRSAWAVTAEGELDTAVYKGVLRSHRTVSVRGVGNLYSGDYYVGRVLHTIAGNSYRQQFELRRNAGGLTGGEEFTDDGALE